MTHKWTDLSQANAYHYVAHPVRHISILVVYSVAVVIGIRKFARRIAEAQLESRTNDIRRW